MIILTVILGVLVVILGYTTFNLLRKLEKQEDIVNNQATILASYLSYLNKISDIIEFSDKKLKEVDHKGSFKSDDEVGFFFEEIKQIQDTLNQFKVKNL
jgi:Tfp pilus assembly protein PilO